MEVGVGGKGSEGGKEERRGKCNVTSVGHTLDRTGGREEMWL